MIKRCIDYSKCINCKQCVRDCVNGFIMDKDSSGNNMRYPAFAERGVCLDCGHCDAICPTGAIEREYEYQVCNEDLLLNFMARKRTVRHYIKGAIVEKDVLDNIIIAGQSAPTDRNRKTCRIVLVKDKLEELYKEAVNYLWNEVAKDGTINPLYTSTKRMIENVDEIMWNAEYLVCLAGNSQYIVDGAIAAERMQLEAESLGVSTAYRGDMRNAINNSAKCRDILNLRSNEEVLTAFAMGYSDIKYKNPSVKSNKKVYYL